MKLSTCLTALAATALTLNIHAQVVHYGPNTGTLGLANSFFGSHSGHDATTSSSFNAAFGYQSLRKNTTGQYNTAVGSYSMYNNTTDSYNTALGSKTLYYNSGSNNVAIGYCALYKNNTGYKNNALGAFSLYHNTFGAYNTAMGDRALYKNTGGSSNTAFGSQALYENTTGFKNTALGHNAGYNTSTGYQNTFIGHSSGKSNTTGYRNIAIGYQALEDHTESTNNVALGYISLNKITTGYFNTAVGSNSLQNITNGNNNTVLGGDAATLLNMGNDNVAIGRASLFIVNNGNQNVSIGSYTGATSLGSYTNSIALGYRTRFSASNQTRIGNSNMMSIGGAVAWTNVSDARFKTNVQEDVLGLKFINALRPVTYELDRNAIAEFDNQLPEGDKYAPVANTTHTGFIAQEVEATAKALGFDRFDGVDAPTNEHSRYGLRYATFVVPLVKSVQELSTQNDELRQHLANQQTQLKTQQAQIKQQQAQINALLKLAQQRTSNTDYIETNQGASLEQNMPNPFSEATSIRMNLPNTAQDAYLLVTNLEGKQLFQQVIQERGTTTLTIQAKELPAGLYLYTLVIDGQLIDSKKMLITQ